LFDLVLPTPGTDYERVYSLNLHEELVLAPMGLFHPAMFRPIALEQYFENNADFHEHDDCANAASYLAVCYISIVYLSTHANELFLDGWYFG
jgi:hypothetical protein